MDKLKCCIAQDLMPLYIDNVLSEGSAQELKNHLAECDCCRKEFQLLSKELVLPSDSTIQGENLRMMKKLKHSWTKKQILISLLSAAIAVFLLFPIRDGIVESELFHPTTSACAGQVGQLYLGKLSDGEEWTRLSFIKKKLFNNATSWNEPYLIFDNPFYQKKIVNSGNSSTEVQMRILDAQGNLVLHPFTIQPGESVSVENLKANTPYIVEYRAAGDYYAFSFY